MSASVKDADSIRVRERAVRIDSVPEADKSSRYEKLTDADFRMVAEELGVEVAAIKAVVSIEAGGCDERILGSGRAGDKFRPDHVQPVPLESFRQKRRQRGRRSLRGFQDMRGASGHS